MPSRAPYAAALTLTATIALAACAIAIGVVLLLVHPTSGLGPLAGLVNQQRQGAKTGVYVAAFLLILPGSIWLGPRVADALEERVGPRATGCLTALLAGTFAIAVVAVRLSHGLPWHDGLATLLAATVAWMILAALVSALVVRRTSHIGARLAAHEREAWAFALAAAFSAILCVTPVRHLSPAGLAVGAAATAAVVVLAGRLRGARPARPLGTTVDLIAVLIALVAIPNVVVYTTTGALPNIYVPPGIVQFQQNWILGPANQVLGGGTLLAGSPTSQYGVGLVYFVAGWFRLVPIGYGTFGLLDGLLTGAFYAAGYGVLRLAGVRRPLAISTLALAILTLVYNLHFPVGQLPEQGPLRFGMPILLLLFTLVAHRAVSSRPAAARPGRAATFAVLGLSSIWALEAFAYTLVTFLALVGTEAMLRTESGPQRPWVRRQLALGVLACLCFQIVFALATLLAAGRLPDWGQYFAYLHTLLGGSASLSYGFARWSPVLAIGAACLTSAAGLILLLRRAPQVARARPARTLALAGTTAYAIAQFTYSDNRSSTYLVAYTVLPILLGGALWLSLALEAPVTRAARRTALCSAAALATLMLGAAWSAIGSHFPDTALAHLYPGGGLRAALHRLAHPPPIDPRATAGERLLARYMPTGGVVILLPDAPTLQTEILIRSRRPNRLFVGDPWQDNLVPSLWRTKLARQARGLPPGTPVLTDAAGMKPSANGFPQTEWILHALATRFRLVPVTLDPSGLIVAHLVARTTL